MELSGKKTVWKVAKSKDENPEDGAKDDGDGISQDSDEDDGESWCWGLVVRMVVRKWMVVIWNGCFNAAAYFLSD